MRYAQESIGVNAGKIWESLADSPKQTISSLEKTTKLKKEDILLALGWLFKEGKINCESVGKAIKVSLM